MAKHVRLQCFRASQINNNALAMATAMAMTMTMATYIATCSWPVTAPCPDRQCPSAGDWRPAAGGIGNLGVTNIFAGHRARDTSCFAPSPLRDGAGMGTTSNRVSVSSTPAWGGRYLGPALPQGAGARGRRPTTMGHPCPMAVGWVTRCAVDLL